MADDTGSRTGGLMAQVRRSPLFRQLVPMEAQIGWPIPVRRSPGVYLRLPLFAASRADGRTHLHAPYAMITLDTATGRPVEFQDFRYTRPWPVPAETEPVGEFPHDAVRGAVGDYRADRERLLKQYDALVDALRDGGAFGADDEFGELLGRLVEPSLLPYFRVLGPKFYERFLGPGPAAT